MTAEQGELLVSEANRYGLTLMVDHTLVFSPAVRMIRRIVESGELGDVYYYDSVRINLGRFQPDVNVLWDLAVHDLAILDDVLDCRPVAVSATALAHVPGEPENIAYLTLFFAEKLLAHVHVNWISPVKLRRTLLGGSRRMILYDDLEASEKVKVYDRGITFDERPAMEGELRVGYRTGDMWAPRLELSEPLASAAAHFLECIETGRTPLTDGAAGLRVVRLLEAAALSIERRGEPVSVAAYARV